MQTLTTIAVTTARSSMKIISTIAFTTTANFITALQTHKATRTTFKKLFQDPSENSYEFNASLEQSITKDLVIPTLSGFVISTLPAIGLNIINGVFFKGLSDEKALQYAGMGWLLYGLKDVYKDEVKAQIGTSNFSEKGMLYFESFVDPNCEPKACLKLLRSDIDWSIGKDAYNINTIAQTVLLDLIWNDSSSSIEHPEL
jgi:hypothetical protein